MNKILLVFIGGGIGSICRHLISVSFKSLDALAFPIATFIANLIGCFIIGLLVGKVNLDKKMNLLLVTGFCGGFTTFSTFSKESLFLFEEHHLVLAFTYIISSIIIGTILVWAGYAITYKKNSVSK